MARILILRLSALGDVAMTIPVIHSFATQYPQHEVYVVSRAVWQGLFDTLPSNVHFIAAYLTGRHKGLWGLHALYKELKTLHIDYVADFHRVLRTLCFDFRFRLSGIPVATIDKGHRGKKKLIRRENKVFIQQATSFQRYADVLSRLGFPVTLRFNSIYGTGRGNFAEIEPVTGHKEKQVWIGIAPFAKHAGKVYPLELQEQVVSYFAAQPHVTVFLFGGGTAEQEIFQQWMTKYPTLRSMIGKLNLHMELNLISHLDVMLTMDSGNMHLASLVGTPVVSVWGATHPYAGFMGWHQSDENVVQLDMPCRPCSVFGQIPCYRGDYACLKNITPAQIIAKVEAVCYKKSNSHEK